MWYSIVNNTVDFRSKLSKTTGLEASRLAVQDIISKYPPPYRIFISGGVDSQAMLYAWKLFGNNYIPTHITYNKNLNNHEEVALNEFAKKHKLDIDYVDFNALEFFEKEHDSYAHMYECSSPQITTYIKMSQQFINETVIMAGSFLEKYGFFYNRAQHALTIEQNRRKNFIPFFLLSHPDLAYSWLKHDIQNQNSKYIRANYAEKVKGYQSLGFDVVPQEKKYSGFELIKDYYDETFGYRVTNKIKFEFAMKASKRAHDLLLRYPYEKLYPMINYNFLLNDILDK